MPKSQPSPPEFLPLSSQRLLRAMGVLRGPRKLLTARPPAGSAQHERRACDENPTKNIAPMIYDVQINGKNHRLELERTDNGWRCRVNDREAQVDAISPRRDVLSLLIAGKTYEIK